MKSHFPFVVIVLGAALALGGSGCSTPGPHAASPPALNQLTAHEAKAGWKLLFDGQSLTGWRSYNKTDAPTHGWEIKDGILKCVAGGHGGDMITVGEFNDFDLQWDWSEPAKANNGVKYLVTESR